MPRYYKNSMNSYITNSLSEFHVFIFIFNCFQFRHTISCALTIEGQCMTQNKVFITIHVNCKYVKKFR